MTDIEIKTLILASMEGGCPFCHANIQREPPIVRGIQRGLVGDNLKVFIENQTQLLRLSSIDPETMHRVDCTRPAP